MPFTPFHFGPALLFGLLLLRYLDFPSFLVASIILDLEPLLVLALGLNYPLHGFFHSLLGGTTAALALSLIMLGLRNPISHATASLRLGQKSSPKKIILASLAGVYLHISLDSPLYVDIKPLYPLELNPFHSGSVFVGFGIYTLCTILLFAGLLLYLYRFVTAESKPSHRHFNGD